MRHRWFSPRLGQFLTQDPLEYAGGFNRYSYAGFDPINFRDAFGLAPGTGQSGGGDGYGEDDFYPAQGAQGPEEERWGGWGEDFEWTDRGLFQAVREAHTTWAVDGKLYSREWTDADSQLYWSDGPRMGTGGVNGDISPLDFFGPGSFRAVIGATKVASVVGYGAAKRGLARIPRIEPNPEVAMRVGSGGWPGVPFRFAPGAALSKLKIVPKTVLSGGRSGSKVKGLVGPPNTAVRGGGQRAFVTNASGQVILDITKSRVKPVIPGQGFGPKRPPTQQELDILQRVVGGG